MKNDVEKSIPSKEETIVDVELTYTQKTFYRAVLEKNRTFLSMGASSKSNVPSLSNIMMELRKVCNHPYLVAAAEGMWICTINGESANTRQIKDLPAAK